MCRWGGPCAGVRHLGLIALPPAMLMLAGVLAELGGQIKDAIGKLQNATVIDEEALDAVLTCET